MDEYDTTKDISTNADPVTLFDPDIADDNNSSLNWKDIIPSAQLLDEDFIEAVQGSEVREFIKVERIDGGDDYYIIPFDESVKGRYLSRAAIRIDAETSAVITSSYVKEPTRYVQISKAEAIEAVEGAPDGAEARLVYKDAGPTSSAFYPYWEVTVGELKYDVVEK